MEFLNYLVIIPILGFLMIAHEFGHFIVAKTSGITVEEFAIGFPPRIFSFVRGGVSYALNLIPLGAYVKMLGEEDPTDPGSFAAQPKRIRALVLVAGSGMNFLVAVLVLALGYGIGWPVQRVQVGEVAPGSPAEASGFQAGDVVRQLNGSDVNSVDQFISQTAKMKGQEITITVERDGQPVRLTTTPRVNPPEGQGALGIKLAPPQAGGPPVPHNPFESIAFGFRMAVTFVTSTLAAPILLLKGLVSPEAVRPIGLPGMTQYVAGAADATAKSGWLYPLFMITGAFSAGLSVANMLPLPALDGGRLAFVVVEAIRGRRVSPEREGLIHIVGMAVLISIMVFISVHDVITPPAAIDWGIH